MEHINFLGNLELLVYRQFLKSTSHAAAVFRARYFEQVVRGWGLVAKVTGRGCKLLLRSSPVVPLRHLL